MISQFMVRNISVLEFCFKPQSRKWECKLNHLKAWNRISSANALLRKTFLEKGLVVLSEVLALAYAVVSVGVGTKVPKAGAPPWQLVSGIPQRRAGGCTPGTASPETREKATLSFMTHAGKSSSIPAAAFPGLRTSGEWTSRVHILRRAEPAAPGWRGGVVWMHLPWRESAARLAPSEGALKRAGKYALVNSTFNSAIAISTFCSKIKNWKHVTWNWNGSLE